MMQRIPLIGGSYSARSVIASATRCINLYPEVNPKDSPSPTTHYQRPGMPKLSSPPAAGWGRSLYQSSNGTGYAVVGSNVYRVESDWSWTFMGSIAPGKSTPASLTDNGNQVMVVDGSPFGWTIDMQSYAFAQIVDPTGIFTGADKVDNIDGYILWNIPNTRQFGSTLNNEIVFDALFFASKSNYPDPLQTLIVNRHELLLPGRLKSELWYDAGNPLFPFAELPGAYIEHGIVAKYSLASADISVFWLGMDLQGQGVVFRQQGYQCTRVSNHALEYQLQQMVAKGATLSDAIGYTYQQGGHVFYILQFPSGNQTWAFDMAIEDPVNAWHQRAWVDGNGGLNRDRSNCVAFLYGKVVALDWETGDLYEFNPNAQYDTVAGTTYFLPCIRSFPHIMSGFDPAQRAIVDAAGRMLTIKRFQLDIEVGTVDPAFFGDATPQVSLRWSNDRGKTFGNAVLQTAGKQGEFSTRPDWRMLGQAMDMILEVSYTYPGAAALNGAWIDVDVMNQ